MNSRANRSSYAAWWWTIDRTALVVMLVLITIGLMLAFAASPAATGGPLTAGDFRYTIKQIMFQSSSTNLFIMKNSTVTNRLDGGGKRTEITDSTLNNFGPGVWAYGGTNGATICTRCNIATFNFDMRILQNDNPSPYSMSA